MKKYLIAVAVMMIATCTTTWANGYQEIENRVDTNKSDYELWRATFGSPGVQTVRLPNGIGTFKLNKKGEVFSNVVFIDSAGKQHRLPPVSPDTDGIPRPDCKFLVPNACFGTPDKNIILCICKLTELATGNEEYLLNYYVSKQISNVN